MCGLVAAIVTDRVGRISAELIERMTASLVHRGPDDSGTLFSRSRSVGLGFRRLSILDLSVAGHQPMISADGRHAIIYNGEIYNYVELRRELEALGRRFRSTGDTEVLLAAYQEWGTACLQRLNGMWAFLILDLDSGAVFGARDRFGVKPLYYCQTRDKLLFASEIKGIVASGEYRRDTNWNAVARHLLRNALDVSDETFYAGIRQIPAGSAFEIDPVAGWSSFRYWQIGRDSYSRTDSPFDAFAELFEDSVRLRLRSDVPVGICLSGGLDSTSIICSAARLKQPSPREDLRPTLAFCFMAEEFDEARQIEDTLAQTKAGLRRLETSAERVWQDMPTMLAFQDEPVHSLTAVIGYQLMRLAAEHGVRVILNGQGADETLAGYPSYFPHYWHELVRHFKPLRAWREIRAYAQAHGKDGSALLMRQARILVSRLLSVMPAYQRMSAEREYSSRLADDWLSGDFKQYLAPLAAARADFSLDAELRRSVEITPLPLYLRVEDRNSMAHSVEVRLPFMDYRLVSLAFQLADEFKLHGPYNKFLLRRSMEGRIPPSVRERVQKFGFPTPVDAWFRGPLAHEVAALLHDSTLLDPAIFNTRAILRDFTRHQKGEIAVGSKLFDVTQLAIWLARMRTGATMARAGSAGMPAATPPLLRADSAQA